MHEYQVALPAEFHGMLEGLVVIIAVQHDLAAQVSDRLDLDLGRGERHHDERRYAARPCRERHALRVIAGRCADDPAFCADRGQLRDLVVGTTNFERKDRLLVFPLEQYFVVQTLGKPRRDMQRGFDGDIVDLRLQDAIDVRFLHLGFRFGAPTLA